MSQADITGLSSSAFIAAPHSSALLRAGFFNTLAALPPFSSVLNALPFSPQSGLGHGSSELLPEPSNFASPPAEPEGFPFY